MNWGSYRKDNPLVFACAAARGERGRLPLPRVDDSQQRARPLHDKRDATRRTLSKKRAESARLSSRRQRRAGSRPESSLTITPALPFRPSSPLPSDLVGNMILSVIIFNTAGAPRLSKFYTPTPPATQRALIASIFQLVSTRPTGGQVCSFLDAPELREGFGEDARVVYRCASSL